MARQILPATIRQRQSPLAGLTWNRGLPVIAVLGVACLLLLVLSGDIKSWIKAPLSSPNARNLSEALYSHTSPSSKGAALASDSTGDDTLVLYLYDNSDPVYSDNFRFFLQEGVAALDGCQYIIVVPDALLKGKHLPKLPENAKFFPVDPAACHFGMGTFGLVLKSEKISDNSFKHFIFASSRARGPFMAPYLQSTMHWTRLFTRLLNDDVKLVGPTVSCQNVLHGVDPSLTVNLTSVPHVQFTAMATDQEGFRLMQQQRTIFECRHAAWEDEYWSVMQASHVMVNSSHNLAAFMARYQGVDWRNTKNWDCNSRLNPVGEFFYDGSTITPFEVMFVTMNSMIVENNWSFARQAFLYQNWMSAQDTDTLDVNTNFWVTDPWSIKHQRIAYMQSRGPGCFDHRYYLKKNPDLAVLKTVLELWDHFVMLGQFEGRSYRWSCDDDRKLPF